MGRAQSAPEIGMDLGGISQSGEVFAHNDGSNWKSMCKLQHRNVKIPELGLSLRDPCEFALNH